MLRCKECGQDAVVTIKPHTFDHKEGPVTIPEIKHYVCPACGAESVDAGDFKKIREYLGLLSSEELDYFLGASPEEKLLQEIQAMAMMVSEGAAVLAADKEAPNRLEALEEIHRRLDGILEILDMMDLLGDVEY